MAVSLAKPPVNQAAQSTRFATVSVVRYQDGRRPQQVLFFNNPELSYADRLEAALVSAEALSNPATCPETHSYRVHIGQ